MRWFRHGFAIATTIVACARVEALPAQAATHSQYPPTGVLVDVGGYRVHLNCTGAGRPAVVIVGAGYSFDWSLVQSPISTVTRVCTYDPAGSAWSDPGPVVTCDTRVLEIHRMLKNGGIADPVVLVGHSIGAVFARMYAARYPKEVDGMILSDHAGRYRFAPPPPSPFGATPVVRFVIGNASLAASDDYRKVQSELLALSRSGTSMTAATSGHDTPLEDPESLVRAIKKVVDDIRKR